MNRKEFISSCACGLCSCAAVGVLVPSQANAAEAKPPEDWRLPFVKRRYAKLLEILASRLDERSMSEILEQLGRQCGSEWPLIQRHIGDIDGFIRERKRVNEEITYDREKGVITVVGPEGSCGCPLVDPRTTPSHACQCSLGYAQYAYETLLGKKVQVELKESILRGGKRCVGEIRVLPRGA